MLVATFPFFLAERAVYGECKSLPVRNLDWLGAVPVVTSGSASFRSVGESVVEGRVPHRICYRHGAILHFGLRKHELYIVVVILVPHMFCVLESNALLCAKCVIVLD
jgi:hypothetical protein